MAPRGFDAELELHIGILLRSIFVSDAVGFYLIKKKTVYIERDALFHNGR